MTEFWDFLQKSIVDPHWFRTTLVVVYLVSFILLLPIILYTNFRSRLKFRKHVKIHPLEGLSEEERNDRAAIIIDRIDSLLTPYKADDGSDMITITKGSQTKFMKQGLDYINKRLGPTDETVIEGVDILTDIYRNRTKRRFTGSRWVILCSICTALFLYKVLHVNVIFIYIHIFGILFYILSSRTTAYQIEKRMKKNTGLKGMLGSISYSGLLLNDGVKYYERDQYGHKSRDWESEGDSLIVRIFIIAPIIMTIGIAITFFGVISFIANYSTSFLLPFNPIERWYDRNFISVKA
jgi:hypothetical protein